MGGRERRSHHEEEDKLAVGHSEQSPNFCSRRKG